MFAIVARRLRRALGRETELDRAWSEWGLLRGELTAATASRPPPTAAASWTTSRPWPPPPTASPPTRTRIIALEVFENTLYHGGRPHLGCDCMPYRERTTERNADVLTGRKPRPVRFAPAEL